MSATIIRIASAIATRRFCNNLPEEVRDRLGSINVAVSASEVDEARAVIEALTAAGYAVVPVEPTEAMIEEGAKRVLVGIVHSKGYTTIADDTYRAMIAAAPQG